MYCEINTHGYNHQTKNQRRNKLCPKACFRLQPGPAALPLEVLQQAQAEMLDYKGTGMSVMEISHRSKEFEAILPMRKTTFVT